MLPRLLFTLEDFVERGGELLLMDTGSSDDTIAIARHYGARIEEVYGQFDSKLDRDQAVEIDRRFAIEGDAPLATPEERMFHFGDARQHAGLLAANDFVLQPDAGDQLSAMDVDAIDQAIAAGGVSAFEYTQHYGNDVLRIARFYDRNCYRWKGRVHEVLFPTTDGPPLPKVRWDKTQLAVRHHHDPFKARSYLAGLALEVMDRPEEPRWWHYLGRDLLYHYKYRSAIAVLDKHVAMESAWITERSQSCCFIGECYEELGSISEAKAAYRRAFELDATRREPLLRLAKLCCERREFEDAVNYATESLAIPQTNAYPELEVYYTWFPHSLLYWSLFWLGRKREAREHWEIYRSLAPLHTILREHARLFPPVGDAASASPAPAPGR